MITLFSEKNNVENLLKTTAHDDGIQTNKRIQHAFRCNVILHRTHAKFKPTFFYTRNENRLRRTKPVPHPSPSRRIRVSLSHSDAVTSRVDWRLPPRFRPLSAVGGNECQRWQTECAVISRPLDIYRVCARAFVFLFLAGTHTRLVCSINTYAFNTLTFCFGVGYTCRLCTRLLDSACQ